MRELDLLFEDDYMLVVNKPAGIATQAPRQFDSLEARVRRYLETTVDSNHTPYVGIPHRLDRCVSGAIVFAKRKRPAQRISRQFERREVKKSYLAIVSNRVEQTEGTWRDTMRKIPDEPKAELVSADHEGAKTAVLHYRLITSNDVASKLSIRLETGRMHQIRLQCSARGHAIWGDLTYGSDVPFGPDVRHERERQIALHAATLELEHPRRRELMAFEAPLPDTWDFTTSEL